MPVGSLHPRRVDKLSANFITFCTPHRWNDRHLISNSICEGDDDDLVKYQQPIHVGRDCKEDCKILAEDDGCTCYRDCSKYRKPRICYYKFFVEQYSAMGA